MKNANSISGLIVIIIAGFFYALTFDFPDSSNQAVGAEFMPRVYCIFLFVLGAMLIFQGVREKSHPTQEEDTFKYSAITMLLVLVYLIIIPFIGFYISTFLLILSLLLFSKVKSWIVLISIPVGTNLFILIFFQNFLNVSIPMGSLFS